MSRYPQRRYWDGRTVHVTTLNAERERRNVEIALTPDTAGHLANLLRSQTGLGNLLSPLPEGLHELMVALDYVLVADPASVAAHRRMEASKGMDPAEASRDHTYWPTQRPGWGEEFRCGWSKNGRMCGLTEDEHPAIRVPRPLRMTDSVNHPFVETARGRCAASGCSAPPQEHEGWNDTTDPGLRMLRRNPVTESGYPLGNRGESNG
jgi:hypothetical protein